MYYMDYMHIRLIASFLYHLNKSNRATLPVHSTIQRNVTKRQLTWHDNGIVLRARYVRDWLLRNNNNGGSVIFRWRLPDRK